MELYCEFIQKVSEHVILEHRIVVEKDSARDIVESLLMLGEKIMKTGSASFTLMYTDAKTTQQNFLALNDVITLKTNLFDILKEVKSNAVSQ